MPGANIVVLPKSCDDVESWDRLIGKLRAFRLDALRNSPEAFSSTYTEWQSFGKEFYEEKLRNPRATHIVSLASTPSDSTTNVKSTLQDILECEWLASSVLIRSKEQDLSRFSASQSPWESIKPQADNAIDEGSRIDGGMILFMVNGVYVAPATRGSGVGTAHMNGAIEAGNAIGRTEGAPKVHYQVRVVSTNTSAVKLYQRLKFTMVGEERVMMKAKVKNGAVIPAQEVCVWVMDRVETLT
jgi:GNAT superfamily N-acetyltransferase